MDRDSDEYKQKRDALAQVIKDCASDRVEHPLSYAGDYIMFYDELLRRKTKGEEPGRKSINLDRLHGYAALGNMKGKSVVLSQAQRKIIDTAHQLLCG